MGSDERGWQLVVSGTLFEDQVQKKENRKKRCDLCRLVGRERKNKCEQEV